LTFYFGSVRLATTWMNEEWYNDQIRLKKERDWVSTCRISLSASSLTCYQRPNYEAWLNQIVASYQTVLDVKDKTFARFLLDLPSIPVDVLELLRELCTDSSRWVQPVAFFTSLVFEIVLALIECKSASQPCVVWSCRDHRCGWRH